VNRATSVPHTGSVRAIRPSDAKGRPSDGELGSVSRRPFAVVVVLLALMVVVPHLAGARREALRTEVESRLTPARTGLLEAQRALAVSVAAMRGYLVTRDTAFLSEMRSEFAQVRGASERFAEASARLDPEAAASRRDFLAATAGWVEYGAALSNAPTDAAGLAATLRAGQAHLTRAAAAANRMAASLDASEIDARRRIRASEHGEDALVAALGFTALLVCLFIARLMQRLGALSHRLAGRVDEEAALHRLARDLGGAGSLADVARAVTRSAHLSTGSLGAYLEHAGAETVEVIGASGEGSPPVGAPAPYPGSATREIADAMENGSRAGSGRPLDGTAPHLVRHGQRHSRLVVPLLATEGVLGALVLVRAQARERRHEAREAPHLRAIADLATGAIRQVALTKRLRESEERFRLLAENLRELVWISDPEYTRYDYLNPAYEAIWGQSARTAREDPLSFVDSVHPEDRERVEAALAAYPSGRFRAEYRIVRPDGEVRWISARAYPVRDEGGQIFRIAGIAEDVTVRKGTEEERERLLESERRARAVAEAALHLRDRVLRIVSHDLRDPLHTIGLVAGVLELPLPKAERARQVEIIRRTVERANRMVLDLLDAARVESGSAIAVDPGPVAVSPLLAEVTEAFRLRAEGKRQLLGWDVEPDVPTILADRDRVHQVLTNLLGNAVKFTPEGGCIGLRAKRLGEGEVRFSVADTGPGIPEEILPDLFEPFAQAKDSASLGTGLGLSIARGIVVAHSGRIWAESPPGGGAIFHFTMPAVASSPACMSLPETSGVG
jgi:PAS domain S-box-containing protein